MANTLTSLERWEPFIANTYNQVSSAGPADAGKYLDSERNHVASVFRANFEGKGMENDALAPALAANFLLLWNQLPERGASLDDHARMSRILFTIATHARFVRNMLNIARVTDTSTFSLTSLFLREGQRKDVGKKDQPGPLVHQATNVAMSWLDVPYPAMDIPGLVTRLQQTPTQVACTRAGANETIEGFVGYEIVDHAKRRQVTPTTETFAGDRTVRVNKSGMGATETMVNVLGWSEELPRSVTIAIVDTILTLRNDQLLGVLSREELAARVPRKV